MFVAVEILTIGEIPQLLQDNPELSPELLTVLIQIVAEADKALASGETTKDWNQDYSKAFAAIVETLHLLRDKTLPKSIEEGRAEDPTHRRRPLEW